MVSITIRVLGKPVPQGRPRGRIVFPRPKKPGEKAPPPFIHYHQPQKSIDWQAQIRAVGELIARREGWRMRPKSHRLQGAVFVSPRRNKDGSTPVRPGDLDNLEKAALDGLQGVLYEDDQQIAPLLADWIPASERGGLVIVVADWEPEVSRRLRAFYGV